MAANTSPIYTVKPDNTTDNSTGMPIPITAAAADYTGVSANYRQSHLAGADGSYVRSIICKSNGTNVAAVARVFLNNGSTNATATNNALIAEISLPATTASTTAGTVEFEIPIEMGIKAGHKLFIGLGAAVAAGWTFTVVAGQYS